MKTLLLSLFLFCLSLPAWAQTENENTTTTDSVAQNKMKGVFFVQIPSKLNIKDNIFVQNRSPYLILQMVVAVQTDDGRYEPIGNASYLNSGKVAKIASYDDNKLKKLRGKTLLIKAKGAKVNLLSSGTDVAVSTPFGSVGVNGSKISAEDVAKITDDQITYDFSATVFESEHDLYIQLEGKDILDF